MKLFYRKYGAGPPLIILHGLMGSSDNWVSIAKRISTSFTVYLPDMRNHGLSPYNDINDYDSISTDLLEFTDEHELGKFFLAGHSMGGKASVHFTLKYPGKIAGLLVADISPFRTANTISKEFDQGLKLLRIILETDVSGAESRNDIEALLAGKVPSVKFRAFIMKNLRRTPNNKFEWKINANALMRNIEEIMDGLPHETGLNTVISGFPVIFLKGEKSGYLPSGDWDYIVRIFPGAVLKIIKNSGHWIHADNPEEVSGALLSLLD
jgi:esterase